MKYFWYDTWYINLYLTTKFKLLDLEQGINNFNANHLGSEEYKSLIAINFLFSKRPWGMIHDITDHVAHPMNVVTKTPYRFRLCKDSFADTCMQMAKKISANTDKRICVNWSGGIDSTSVLVAMLQTVPHDRITVVCNQSSIEEYPGFYRDIIHNKLQTMDLWSWQQQASNFYTISGDAGDTVWGVLDDSFWKKFGTSCHDSWRTWINPAKVDPNFVESLCERSGRTIDSILDLRTWYYLSCKWQDKAMRFYTYQPGCNPSMATPFYDFDDSFMIWTMNNLDKILGQTWQSYKLPAKQFIYQYHRDQNYYENKSKVNSVSFPYSSLMHKIRTNTGAVAIDQTYQCHNPMCWPFVDQKHFEDWNDVHQLIPLKLLS